MLDDSVLKVSPNGSFKVTQLCESIAICEAMKGDRAMRARSLLSSRSQV
jgi:hypothetical protein